MTHLASPPPPRPAPVRSPPPTRGPSEPGLGHSGGPARADGPVVGPAKRRFQFHAKLVTTHGAERTIAGYASTREVDRAGEVVEPAAFRDSLTTFLRNPILTYMHNWADPIGRVTDAVIDERGLAITAQLSKTADKVWTLIEEGVLRALSIGYDVLEEHFDAGVNHITKLRLYEVAVVSIPANQHCLFSVSKALCHGTDLLCPACAGPLTGGLVLSPSDAREACALLQDLIVAWPGQAA